MVRGMVIDRKRAGERLRCDMGKNTPHPNPLLRTPVAEFVASRRLGSPQGERHVETCGRCGVRGRETVAQYGCERNVPNHETNPFYFLSIIDGTDLFAGTCVFCR